MLLCVAPIVKGQQDTLQVITDTIPVKKHSPAKAAFLSAVVPGLGQIYNGKGLYYRLPVLYLGLVAEAVAITIINKDYNTIHTAYVTLNNYLNTVSGTPEITKINKILGSLGSINSTTSITLVNASLLSETQRQRHYRDLNIIGMAGIYFLNIVDATVQAYFFDYDISNNLSLKVRPTIMNTLANTNVPGLKLTFNLH